VFTASLNLSSHTVMYIQLYESLEYWYPNSVRVVEKIKGVKRVLQSEARRAKDLGLKGQ